MVEGRSRESLGAQRAFGTDPEWPGDGSSVSHAWCHLCLPIEWYGTKRAKEGRLATVRRASPRNFDIRSAEDPHRGHSHGNGSFLDGSGPARRSGGDDRDG